MVKKTKNITSFVKTACFAYVGIKLGDQNQSWTPHTVCSVCVEDLRNWTRGKKKTLWFGMPMVWRQPVNHVDDCCFCMCALKGFHTKNMKGVTYPNLPSAIKPVPHGPDIPVPNPPKQPYTPEVESSATPDELSEDSEYGIDMHGTSESFARTELNDLVRDLNLPKDAV
jgi:uncharacterized protein (DUF2237 family)